MDFKEVVLENLEEDFGKLLPISPGYLACNIVAGYGSCRKGIISEEAEEESVLLAKPEELDFETVLKVISAFSSSNPKKPFFSSLLFFISLIVPFEKSFIHRLYEIEEKEGKILLKRQSSREG